MEELDMKQILKYTYEKKNILIIILIIAILIGMLYTYVVKVPIYEVTAQILVDKADESIEDFAMSEDILNNDKIRVNFDKSSKLIEITIEMNEPEQAFNIINQYIGNLQTKLEEVYDIEKFEIIETPKIPQEAKNISYSQDIIISALIGVAVYVAYILGIINMSGILNSTVIENNTKIKVLGQVRLEKKKNKKQVNTNNYTSRDKNNINQLKRIEANIELKKENRNPKCILLTGTKKEIGNTYITNNLALQYTKFYKKVLIIDTDMGNKTLTNLYHQQSQRGLVNILKENNIENVEQLVQKTEKENIFILPIGKEKIEEELFLLDTIKAILEELKGKYDIILIDTKPINQYMYPISLASVADATVLVVEYTKTKLQEIIKAKSTIENVGGKISGIVINKTI